MSDILNSNLFDTVINLLECLIEFGKYEQNLYFLLPVVALY